MCKNYDTEIQITSITMYAVYDEAWTLRPPGSLNFVRDAFER